VKALVSSKRRDILTPLHYVTSQKIRILFSNYNYEQTGNSQISVLKGEGLFREEVQCATFSADVYFQSGVSSSVEEMEFISASFL
jgi:hypothetical protein